MSRRPQILDPTAPDYEVAIIGAGFSGIGMGAALRREGIDNFVIFERADDIGGTWRHNTYPRIGVDIPTFAYQFSTSCTPIGRRRTPVRGRGGFDPASHYPRTGSARARE